MANAFNPGLEEQPGVTMSQATRITGMTETLSCLTDARVRDLAWAIGSPCLFDARQRDDLVSDTFCQSALVEAWPWLKRLDAAPESLHRFIDASPSHRLGYYFERLIEYWLRHCSGVELLATRLAYRSAERTLGELDFLFDDQGIVTHWETAIKLYLNVGGTDLNAFVGPRARDRLDLKYAKLFETQLTLPTRIDPAWWPDALTPPAASRAFVKGYLFYRRDKPVLAHSPIISATHLRGWWCFRGECETELPSHSQWLLLGRMAWLAPAFFPAGRCPLLMTTFDLARRLNAHDGAVLLAEIAETERGFEEISRGFIVPDDWPGLQRSWHSSC